MLFEISNTEYKDWDNQAVFLCHLDLKLIQFEFCRRLFDSKLLLFIFLGIFSALRALQVFHLFLVRSSAIGLGQGHSSLRLIRKVKVIHENAIGVIRQRI